MSTKKTSPNNSLILRGTIWHLHWNVPRDLRSNPLFRGKAIYSTTLKTRDVHEARKMRDKLVSKFQQLADVSATQAARHAFLAHYAEATKAAEEAKRKLVYLDGKEAFNVMDGLWQAFDVEAAFEQGVTVKADAYLAALHDRHEVVEPYAITLKEAASEFIKEHEGEIAAATISRVKNASASIIKAIGDKDVKLKDVTGRQVTRWIKAISKTASDSTRRGYIGALHKMWYWAWEHEHVEGTSPFKGVKMVQQGDGTSYETFTVEETQRLVELASPALLVLVLARFGLITGCRISELVGLSHDSFIVVDDIHTFQIKDGKTDAAARTIPLPTHLWEELKGCVGAGMWEGSTSARWSHRFGNLKEEATGKRDRSKGFHSFRHMTATAYEREHIEERIVSVLLGHKNKRGESMSYGLYSAGLAPKQYLEAVEKMIAGEYMQSYLSLFPQ